MPKFHQKYNKTPFFQSQNYPFKNSQIFMAKMFRTNNAQIPPKFQGYCFCNVSISLSKLPDSDQKAKTATIHFQYCKSFTRSSLIGRFLF